MAIFFKTDSPKGVEVSPKNGTDFTLDELKDIVGGYIEILPLGKKYLMVVNDEGKLQGLPINHAATSVLCNVYRTNDYIVGNALICKTSEIK